MKILGGWVFFMSEVPLYTSSQFFWIKSTHQQNNQLQNSSLPIGQRYVERGQFLWGPDLSPKSEEAVRASNVKLKRLRMAPLTHTSLTSLRVFLNLSTTKPLYY
jgi:hypothetical protein